jgi:hypothetical protein
VNLFVAGWRPAGGRIDPAAAERAIARLLEELPFFPGRPVESWAASSGLCAAAWVSHDAGVPYACEREGSLALFSGRPFRWTDDAEADGRGPADARFFLAPADRWAGAIDGRFAAVAYHAGDEALELVTDPVGAYPLHEVEADGTRWFSNSAAALRELSGDRGLRLDSVAGLVGGGWPLEGHPVWGGLSRVEPGAVIRLSRDGEASRSPLPARELARMPGRGLDAEAAARRLTAATAALSDWPGRPAVVPVTGGRDSRVVLSAALAAGLEVEGVTGGAPDDPDVLVAARLCRIAGVPHSLLPADPHGNLWSDHRRAARIVRLTAGGTASLADAAGFPLGPREGPLPLWHSGQGGEIGRAYYGSGEGLDAAGLARRLYDAFTARRPHRRELLSAAGRDLVEGQIRGWVDARLQDGARPGDVPDLFYLERRMATWAAPSHGCVEYVRDTTSPLWSRRVVADLLAPGPRERAGAAYHRRVLDLLRPALAQPPLADGRAWESTPRRLARGRTLARKMAREAVRRARARRVGPAGMGAATADPLEPILADVRQQVLTAESHQAWEVLDRGRCEALLTRPAAALDEMSRYHVWRLATLFVAD